MELGNQGAEHFTLWGAACVMIVERSVLPFYSLMLRFVNDTFDPEVPATIGEYDNINSISTITMLYSVTPPLRS